MLIHWIWFAHRPNVNDRLKAALLQHFRDPEDIYFADGEAYRHVEGMTAEAAASLQEKELISAEEILECSSITKGSFRIWMQCPPSGW